MLDNRSHRVEREPVAQPEETIGGAANADVIVVRPAFAQYTVLILHSTAVEALKFQAVRCFTIAGFKILMLIQEVAVHHVNRITAKLELAKVIDLLLWRLRVVDRDGSIVRR